MTETQIVTRSAYRDVWHVALAEAAERSLGLDLERVRGTVPLSSAAVRDPMYEPIGCLGILSLRKLMKWCKGRRLTDDETLLFRMLSILSEEHGLDNVGIAVVAEERKK